MIIRDTLHAVNRIGFPILLGWPLSETDMGTLWNVLQTTLWTLLASIFARAFDSMTRDTHMGYRCPVCNSPQVDATHLANHVAFTALVRGGDHEAWLAETVTDWADMGEDALASELTNHVQRVDLDIEPDRDGQRASTIGEPATDASQATDRSSTEHGTVDHYDSTHNRPQSDPGDGDASTEFPGVHSPAEHDDEVVESVLDRARELTRQRGANADSDLDDEDRNGTPSNGEDSDNGSSSDRD